MKAACFRRDGYGFLEIDRAELAPQGG